MASETVSIRVPKDTKHWLERFSRSRGSVSSAAARLIEEAKRREQFRFIDFRDTQFGRIAYIQGTRIPVYLARMTASDFGDDPGRLAEHYGWPLAKAESVLTYAAAHLDEINENIADHRELDDFDALKRMIPTLQNSSSNERS